MCFLEKHLSFSSVQSKQCLSMHTSTFEDSVPCEVLLNIHLFNHNCSEFSDIFNVKHFKRTLQADVRVVSSLPSTHLMSRQSIENQLPYNISPFWIRARFFKQVWQKNLTLMSLYININSLHETLPIFLS